VTHEPSSDPREHPAEPVVYHGRPNSDAFVLDAEQPAAPEPRTKPVTGHDWVRLYERAESAEAQLAAVREILLETRAKVTGNLAGAAFSAAHCAESEALRLLGDMLLTQPTPGAGTGETKPVAEARRVTVRHLEANRFEWRRKR
jgi:hypothetical protein